MAFQPVNDNKPEACQCVQPYEAPRITSLGTLQNTVLGGSGTSLEDATTRFDAGSIGGPLDASP